MKNRGNDRNKTRMKKQKIYKRRRRYTAIAVSLIAVMFSYGVLTTFSSLENEHDMSMNEVSVKTAEGSENNGNTADNNEDVFASERIKNEIFAQQKSATGTASNAYTSPISGMYFADTYDDDGCQHDIECETGTPLRAITDGTAYYYVSYGTDKDGKYYMSYGKWVLLAGSDNATAAIYAHLSEFETEDYTEVSRTEIESETAVTTVVSVRKAEVKKGDILGYVGETGNAFGSHLHFELYRNGERVNPPDYV